MYNPFKRAPLSFKDNNGNNLVVFELSMLKEDKAQDSILLSDLSIESEPQVISRKIEEFVRFVYETCASEYTPDNLVSFMSAWRIDEKEISSTFLSLMERIDKDEINLIRVLGIYSNQFIRFSASFIGDEKDTNADLKPDGSCTKSFVKPVRREGNYEQHSYLFAVEIPSDADKLENFRTSTTMVARVKEAVSCFMLHNENFFNSFARSQYQNYRSRLQNTGASSAVLSGIKAPKFSSFINKPEFYQTQISIDDINGLVIDAITETITKSDADRQCEEFKVSNHVLLMEVKSWAGYEDNSPTLGIYIDVSSRYRRTYNDNSADEEIISHFLMGSDPFAPNQKENKSDVNVINPNTLTNIK